MEKTIRVLLADDHPLVRAGIRATLVAEGDFALVGEATNGDEVQQMCRELNPDILLLDVQMPGAPAVQTVTYLRAQCPEVRIVILTAHDSDTYIRGLISAGATGYVLKDEAPQVVVRAIRTVIQGDTWFSKPVVDKMAHLGREHAIAANGTDRARNTGATIDGNRQDRSRDWAGSGNLGADGSPTPSRDLLQAGREHACGGYGAGGGTRIGAAMKEQVIPSLSL